MSKFKITFEDVECELIGNEVKMINPWLVYCDHRVVEFVKPIKNIEKIENRIYYEKIRKEMNQFDSSHDIVYKFN